MNVPHERVHWVILPNFHDSFMDSEGASELRRINLDGAFYPKFEHPLAAKPYVGCEHLLNVQEWYGPPQSPWQAWLGSDLARRCRTFFVCPSRFRMTKFVNATLPSTSWNPETILMC